jgi:arylsulfatase A-like enzyme
MQRTWIVLPSLLLGIAALTLGITSSQAQSPTRKPNIVFILTDDEDVQIHAFMPKTRALLEAQGTTFSNYFVTYALCCPSRATILRGQYPHNTSIEGNAMPEGGFQKFYQRGLESSTVAAWLQGAGYQTMLAGKYLNGYGQDRLTTAPATHVPPGWSEWYGGVGSRPYQDYNYELNENGKLVAYRDKAEDYLTDVISRKAAATIRTASSQGKPFFLYLAPFTPHSPANFAPRHANLCTDAKLPRPPSFNESDVNDKPSPVRNRPVLTERQIRQLEALYVKRLRSLQAIDDMVENIVNTLQASGQLENTYIIYTSDNGFHMGEHRLPQGKNTAFEEDIRAPFTVRGPGVPKGQQLEAMVLNTDLAPTFAQIAGANAPDFVDGRSFLGLFGNPSEPWRSGFMVSRRGGPEAQREEGDEPVGIFELNAIRTARYTYVEYGNKERELYDLRADPDQLENIVGRANPELVKQLSARLAELAACKAASCRQAENAPMP